MTRDRSLIPEISPKEILPLSLQHNFWTWSAQARVRPILVTRAEGVSFWDAEGRRYLDFNSMVMCSNIGHGDQRVIEAIAEQARELACASPHMATKARAILGRLLAEITPGDLNRFLYTFTRWA
jgi:taurine---2-oxoglutarate transaminase